MDTARLIARDGLVACLDRAAARKVTIISAPAGCGKTSLLRAWADRPDRAHRIAFVPVRHDEHDAQFFWLAVLNAVRQASGTTRDELPAATPDFNGRAMIDRVLSELAEHRGRVMLVIDDVHELAPDTGRGNAGPAPAGRRVVRAAWPRGRGHPAHPGSGRLA